METLVEKNKSLFSQLKALKARFGSIGGGGSSSKSSSASLSIMVLWLGVGISGDMLYWSDKLETLDNEAVIAIAEAEAASDSNHHFKSRTLQSFDVDDASTADSAYNSSAHLPESCTSYSDACAAYLTPHEKCIVSRLPMLLGDFEVQIDIVWTVLFWAVLSKLAWTFRGKSTGTLVPNAVFIVLGWCCAVEIYEASSWVKLWACSDGAGQNVTLSEQSTHQGLGYGFYQHFQRCIHMYFFFLLLSSFSIHLYRRQ